MFDAQARDGLAVVIAAVGETDASRIASELTGSQLADRYRGLSG